MRLSRPVLFIVVMALIGLLAGEAWANPRVRVFSHCAPSNAAYSYSHSYARVQAVYYPSYSVGYQPDLSALAAAMLASVEEQKAMREDFQRALQAGALGNGKQFTPQHPGLSLMLRDCAVCHDSAVSKSRGGGYAFFNAGRLTADEKQIEAMILAVDEGRMPKNKKWTGDEKYTFLSYHTLRGPDPSPEKQLGQASIAPTPADLDRIIEQRLEIIFERMKQPPQKAPSPKKDPPKDDDGEQPKKKQQ